MDDKRVIAAISTCEDREQPSLGWKGGVAQISRDVERTQRQAWIAASATSRTFEAWRL